MSNNTALSNTELERYSRHILLQQVGMAGQERLKSASVLVIGAGGLGAPALTYLAAAGVGRLGIVDDDRVDLSNLQRQVIHSTADVGRLKVDSAEERIQAINPTIAVEKHPVRLTSDNAIEILRGFDIVIDGTDNFPTRYLLADATELLQIPMVYGSIFQFEGQVSLFNHQGGPGYRDLFPTPPKPHTVPSCAQAGVIGVLPGVIGGLQATETIKVLLGLGDTLSGRLLIYDALAMSFTEFSFERDSHRQPATELIDYQGFCMASPKPQDHAINTVSPIELKTRMASSNPPYLVDIREPLEVTIAKIRETDIVIPLRELTARVGDLPTNKDIVLFCRTGIRSLTAASDLIALGFPASKVSHLEGGIHAWADAIEPSLVKY